MEGRQTRLCCDVSSRRCPMAASCDVGAGQSVSLPARSVQARQPHRAYLKTRKPRSKIILLDAKGISSKQKLFQAAWQQLYPGLLGWVSLSDGGKVTRVDPATNTFETDFGSHKAEVGNVIPPAACRRDRGDGRCRGPHRMVPNRSRHIQIEVAASHPCDRRRGHRRVCLNRRLPRTRRRRCAPKPWHSSSPAMRPRTTADQHLLQPVAPGNAISVAGVYRPVNGQLTDSGRRRCQPAGCTRRTARAGSRIRRCLVQDDHRRDVAMRWHCC